MIFLQTNMKRVLLLLSIAFISCNEQNLVGQGNGVLLSEKELKFEFKPTSKTVYTQCTHWWIDEVIVPDDTLSILTLTDSSVLDKEYYIKLVNDHKLYYQSRSAVVTPVPISDIKTVSILWKWLAIDRNDFNNMTISVTENTSSHPRLAKVVLCEGNTTTTLTITQSNN